MGSLGTGGESDGDYSDEDDEDQGSETNGSMTEDYTDLATSQDGHHGGGYHGDGRDIAVMRQQMEGKTRLDDSKEQRFLSSEADKPLADLRGRQGRSPPLFNFFYFHEVLDKVLAKNRFSPPTRCWYTPSGKSWIHHCKRTNFSYLCGVFSLKLYHTGSAHLPTHWKSSFLHKILCLFQ